MPSRDRKTPASPRPRRSPRTKTTEVDPLDGVTVSLQVLPGGVTVQIEGVTVGALGVVIDRVAAEIDAALRRHELLRDRVQHVPCGAIYVPDERDGGIGFLRRGRAG